MEETKVPPAYMEISLRALLCEAMTIDMAAYDKSQLKHITLLLTAMVSSGSYSFFTVQNLSSVTESMANHAYFRRFVLNLFETASLLRVSFNDGEVEWLEKYKESILKSRAAYGNGKKSILIEPVISWLSISEENLIDMLNMNPWLITLYLACYTGAVEKAIKDYNDFSGFLEEATEK